MRNKNWIYKKNKIMKYDGISQDVDILSILSNRNISTTRELDIFFDGTLEDLGDPMGLAHMDRAVSAIKWAIDHRCKICIFGDYDVDGVTSTSLLYLTLTELGAIVDFYIPVRDEGYGPNIKAMEKIHDSGARLVITVDCGISSIAEIQYCNSLGMDVIVTDHHEINGPLPEALAVINPKRAENTYKFRYLAGVGTAFMLAMALFGAYGAKDKVFKYVDLAAIGTIADIAPLVEDNRIIAKHGLKLLGHTTSLGLRSLLSKLFPDYKTHVFDTFDIGFKIAPVFNAAGRLAQAKMGVTLFTSKDKIECDNLANDMIEKNNRRKQLQDQTSSF